jgi:hypothetical protein
MGTTTDRHQFRRMGRRAAAVPWELGDALKTLHNKLDRAPDGDV